ncbi:MAG: hypothetical protein CFH01_00163 [Alphaproteobacteria bacterium MarineAlpha2_Bin1]|nr:MAG: hypothetical protein CFH01_00163 [Alphaproteobacteria bacterium MarineAlpha2_Bin1]|tara:strand:+ start:930 stop:1268 length:339 start_codon:yes stop_codon:yes gene_type:complete
MSESDNKIRYSVRGKKSRFFESDGVDELVAICMSMAQELWVVKEELALLKNLTMKKGLLTRKELENFKFTIKQKTELDKDNKDFIDRVFFTLRESVEAVDSSHDEPPTPPIP